MSEAPELSYEQARDQLIEVVRELESGNVSLSRSMELWTRGEQLATVCQRWLDGARETIRRAQDAPAAPGAAPRRTAPAASDSGDDDSRE